MAVLLRSSDTDPPLKTAESQARVVTIIDNRMEAWPVTSLALSGPA